MHLAWKTRCNRIKDLKQRSIQPFGIEDLFAQLQKFRHLLEKEHNLGHISMIKLDRVKTSSMNSCQAPMKNTCRHIWIQAKAKTGSTIECIWHEELDAMKIKTWNKGQCNPLTLKSCLLNFANVSSSLSNSAKQIIPSCAFSLANILKITAVPVKDDTRSVRRCMTTKHTKWHAFVSLRFSQHKVYTHRSQYYLLHCRCMLPNFRSPQISIDACQSNGQI